MTGPGATVWKGSAFDCPFGRIILRHTQFASGGAIGLCNNGDVVGRGVLQQNNCFTSQLNITLRSNLNGRSIECVYENVENVTLVGRRVINVTSGNFYHYSIK